MDVNVSGKVVIVTGGTYGIGLAIARTFLRRAPTLSLIGETRRNSMTPSGDLAGMRMGSSPTSRRQTGQRYSTISHRKLGPIEFLVNNIGRFDAEDFFEISDERWHEYFEANVMTGVRITQSRAQKMLARNSGSIIFISSDAAVHSLGHMHHYSMTKTAQTRVVARAGRANRGTNVRVNAYMAGPTATESAQAFFENLATPNGNALSRSWSAIFSSLTCRARSCRN